MYATYSWPYETLVGAFDLTLAILVHTGRSVLSLIEDSLGLCHVFWLPSPILNVAA